MTNYEIKYLKYKKKYDKLKNKFILKVNNDPEFKSLYNIIVNNYLYNDNKTILLKNVIDLNYIINDLNFDLNQNYNLNLKLDTIIETIIENDDL
jgi:hypothetical protein